jgi:glycosyltransferase involved in cell wall biosynthesis
MQNPLISIIIPAYNTERYLDRCVASLCAQAFEDFEAIIIDDGSTDQTGHIADDWAVRDARIKVVHTANSGVAEARNTGLKHAKGLYIGFIDSDDWVEPEMLGTLVEDVKKHDADIAICGHVMETVDGEPLRSGQAAGSSFVLTAHQALVELLIDYKIRLYLWDKLYRRELFDGLSFPTGHLFEDQQILYKLFEKASTVCVNDQPLYHYVQHGESILGAKKLSTEVEYIRSQLTLFRYVCSSGRFSRTELTVLRSSLGKNLISSFRKVRKSPSSEAHEASERLLKEFKSAGLPHRPGLFLLYKAIFGIIKSWGRKL